MVDNLTIQIEIDPGPARRGAEAIVRALERIETQAAGAGGGVSHMEGVLSSLKAALGGQRGLLVGFVVGRAVGEVIRAADSYKILETQLRRVTRSGAWRGGRGLMAA